MGAYLHGGPIYKFHIEKKEGSFSKEEITKWKEILKKNFQLDLFDLFITDLSITAEMNISTIKELTYTLYEALDTIFPNGEMLFDEAVHFKHKRKTVYIEFDEIETIGGPFSYSYFPIEFSNFLSIKDKKLLEDVSMKYEAYSLFSPVGKMGGEEDFKISLYLSMFATAALRDKIGTGIYFCVF